MQICAAHDIGIAVHDDWLFRNVSIELNERDRVALIGPNGAGKTTVLKILAEMLPPDEGTVAKKKTVRIGFLDQIPDYPLSTTVRDVIYSAFEALYALENDLRQLEAKMAACTDDAELTKVFDRYSALQAAFEEAGGYTVDTKVRAVMNGLSLPEPFLDMPFSALSGGQTTRVELARLLASEPQLLLLDEPTNHLDLPSIEWLENFLSSYDGCVVVVSHDRTFLDHVATRVIELDSGEAAAYVGNYTEAMHEREQRLLIEFQSYQEQQKKLKQMEAAIKRLREWANQANPPSAGLHRRATNMQRALDRIQKLSRPVLERRRMALSFDIHARSGQDVVLCAGIRKHFGDTPILRDVNLQVRYGERVALMGANGSGKSTLLRLIVGADVPDAGKLRVGDSVCIGYLRQQEPLEADGMHVLAAFRNAVTHMSPMTEGQARHVLAQFLFYGESVFKQIRTLSGGERVRLRMAQLMYQDVNFLVLDEPTNHLDIESREALEDALESFPGTILAVSHDRHFVHKLFTRVLWLEDGQCVER